MTILYAGIDLAKTMLALQRVAEAGKRALRLRLLSI